MLAEDDQLRAWLPTWRDDGGDARRFRQGMRARFGGDEVAAWRYCEQTLTPLRLRIRRVARALLVYPRYLPVPGGGGGRRRFLAGGPVPGGEALQ